MNGRRFSSSIIIEGGILGALNDLRHRLHHRLIRLAAYGPGYGEGVDESKLSMPPWTEDPAVPLDSAKSAEPARPGRRRHHAA
jgi:hypothetical protein